MLMRRAAAVSLAVAALPSLALCAVHPYSGTFSPLGDAFVFRAGREGLFRSHTEAHSQGSSLSTFAFSRPLTHLVRHSHAASSCISRHSERQLLHTPLRGALPEGSVPHKPQDSHSLSLLTSPFQVEFIRPKDVAARFADSAAEEKTGSITAVVFKARAARTLFSQRPAC